MSEKIRFDSLPLSEGIQEAVKEMGFEFASPIQSEAIPFVMEGRDVIGQAQTGTGKTAAFGIPMIEHIVPFEKYVQAIILCPTRELAVQVSEEMKKLSKFTKGVWVTTVYGGDSIDRQIKSLKAGANIVVGTPGRVIDLIERRALKLNQTSMIVLDEADEMLDMGFREDIESILEEIPNERQTVLFSATMSKPIMALTNRYLTNPKLVKVVKNEITNVNIEQLYYDVKGRAKMEVTTRLIDFYSLKLVLIFCNQKKRVDEVMNRFRGGNVSFLVATDVAARGLDVDNVDAVINYDIPLDEEYYVHRIGRTGRAGKSGKAFTLVVGAERNRLRDIMNYTKVKIDKGVIPTFSDVVGVKKGMFIDRVGATIAEGGLELFDDALPNFQHAGFTVEQVVAALVKMNMGVVKNEFGDENLEGDMERSSRKYGRDERGGGGGRFERGGGGDRWGGGDRGGDRRGAVRFERGGDRGGDRGGRFERGGDRNSAPRGPRVDRDGKPYKSDENMVRLVVNIGFNEKISPSNIVGAFAGESGIPGNVLGQIQIENKHTFVDVPKEYANVVLDKMSGAQIKGKRVNVDIAKADK
jgi:ATP-dependent RNA helicase DeaD